jgi:hypothetical protein
MKVSELKQRLECANDDDDVCVPILLPYNTVGAIPTVSIMFAYSGFDWERGKFIITPEENLTPADRGFETKMKELQDKVGWLEYEKRGLKSEIKRLKKQLGI